MLSWLLSVNPSGTATPMGAALPSRFLQPERHCPPKTPPTDNLIVDVGQDVRQAIMHSTMRCCRRGSPPCERQGRRAPRPHPDRLPNCSWRVSPASRQRSLSRFGPWPWRGKRSRHPAAAATLCEHSCVVAPRPVGSPQSPHPGTPPARDRPLTSPQSSHLPLLTPRRWSKGQGPVFTLAKDR